MKRFEFVQTFENYTDYDTALGGNSQADVPKENIRRLTIDSETKSAYLTLADYSEKTITLKEAESLLAETV